MHSWQESLQLLFCKRLLFAHALRRIVKLPVVEAVFPGKCCSLSLLLHYFGLGAFSCRVLTFVWVPINGMRFSLHVGVKFVRHVGVPEVAVSLMAGGE